MNEVAAGAASAVGYVYDGPSSQTVLDPTKFPGANQNGATTVSGWFAQHSGAEALSQYNGWAIFIDSGAWSPYGLGLFNGPSYTSTGPSSYAVGTMLHELLHKQMIAGGFSHEQIDRALRALGAMPFDSGTANAESLGLAHICF